ncbi:phosphotransferase [Collinsella provencensis]|uniref:phosphotransferase n=1 Tax=Collinsella provencensis TaxID=1937461 RepID=UPI000C859B77|nr:phosphotransferase [Collinsella provencensis]
MLTQKQFTVLAYLQANPNKSQRTIAHHTKLSLGTVNSALKELETLKYVENSGITPEGFEALHPYKVENAIIMAAGLSSRFAPISYEKPKGLLRVRGEVLIERQIEQLREAGIHNITVVVGYKKEYFFYLESKYGVSIVINPEYATRNNHASLMVVREHLGNTYICSSDDYFSVNPFEPYVYEAYYAAQFAEGHTDEWCLETSARNRIKGVHIGGENSWYMLGHVYFDHAFSERFVRILEDEYPRPETTDKLWEDLFLEHVDELSMVVRKYDAGIINEFDSLDELRGFDPHFIENVDTDIFDNIVNTLGCEKTEIRDVYPLKQGLTNLSCHFRIDSGEYVYRHPGVGTELLIDRQGERAALLVAKELGLDNTFIAQDPEKGWKISHFIPNSKQLDPHDPEQVATAMHMARNLHETTVKVERSFDFYEEAKRYESLLLEKGPIEIPGYWEMAEKVDKLEQYVKADNAPTCLCHNDFFALNFLIDQQGSYYLIDWEYAGMSDYANDFGTFCVCCELSEEEIHNALEAYFGRTPTLEETRHNLAHVQFAGWCWYLWSLFKEAEGDAVGEWLYIYYRYAARYLDSTIALYEQE